MKVQIKTATLLVMALLFGISESGSLSLAPGLYAQSSKDRVLPEIPKDNCNFLFVIPSPIEEYCVGDLVVREAILLGEGKGPGTYTYEWEVVGGSQIQIPAGGATDQSQVAVLVTGTQNTNTLKLTVKREGCKDDIPFNSSAVYLTNIDTEVALPSLSIDLGTCGGFPSTNPHWQVLLSATPTSSLYTTVWGGDNVTFLNPSNPADPSTADYGVQFAPNFAGDLEVYVTVTNQCGASTSTYKEFNTNDCGNQILFRKDGTHAQPKVTSSSILRGQSLLLNEEGFEDVSIRIIDLKGQPILRQSLSAPYKFTTSHMTRGIYLIQTIKGDELVSVNKLLLR